MSDHFVAAVSLAREGLEAGVWEAMSPAARTAAIFHQMCRLDSGCQRTGTTADAGLPPCPASDAFIARRACRLAGPRG